MSTREAAKSGKTAKFRRWLTKLGQNRIDLGQDWPNLGELGFL